MLFVEVSQPYWMLFSLLRTETQLFKNVVFNNLENSRGDSMAV